MSSHSKLFGVTDRMRSYLDLVSDFVAGYAAREIHLLTRDQIIHVRTCRACLDEFAAKTLKEAEPCIVKMFESCAKWQVVMDRFLPGDPLSQEALQAIDNRFATAYWFAMHQAWCWRLHLSSEKREIRIRARMARYFRDQPGLARLDSLLASMPAPFAPPVVEKNAEAC